VNATTLPNSYPFVDGAEQNSELNFIPDSPWGFTTVEPHGGNQSWSDSPIGNYAASVNASLLLRINLSTAQMPLLKFWTKYGTQVNGDFCRIEVSTGTTWYIAGYFSGSQSTWKEIKIDLTRWAKNADVQIRFRFNANADATISDGWYIDDISIAETPAITLSYPFYESFDDSTCFLRWHWSQWEILTGGRSAPGMIHDSPTGNYLESGSSGSYSDNPDNITCMITAGVIDLRGTVNPVLTFYHKYDLKRGDDGCAGHETDAGRVYISTNYGLPGSWTYLYGVTGTGHTTSWERVEIDLSQYSGNRDVRFMFVMDEERDQNSYCGDNSGVANGWWIDDIRIENRTSTVTLYPLLNVSMHGATLVWSKSNDSTFVKYEIRRGTSSSVDRSSTLVKIITERSDTTFRDVYQVLQPNKYYYRIYTLDALGTPSYGSNVVDANYSVPTVTFPFADSAEVLSDTTHWAWSSPWGLTTMRAHSGLYSWTDSPGASYEPNANTALSVNVNLSGSATPVLTFWHSYAFEDGYDFGYVEVSTDGGNNWTIIHSITGIDSSWN
jgi:hypothetical protein